MSNPVPRSAETALRSRMCDGKVQMVQAVELLARYLRWGVKA